ESSNVPSMSNKTPSSCTPGVAPLRLFRHITGVHRVDISEQRAHGPAHRGAPSVLVTGHQVRVHPPRDLRARVPPATATLPPRKHPARSGSTRRSSAGTYGVTQSTSRHL